MNIANDYREKTLLQWETLLDALPAARKELLHVEIGHRHLAGLLQAAEDRLLLEGSIEGKNQAERDASLRQKTEGMRAAVAASEVQLIERRVVLACLEDQASCLRNIVRLLQLPNVEF